jgi:uncharacterized protein
MLLDFTVENYRSIKEPVTLSAVAQSRGSKQSADSQNSRVKSDNEIALPYEVPSRNLEILPVVGIFGANASGKTNVIQALDCLLSLMAFGNRLVNVFNITKISPFRLDRDAARQPTKFSLRAVFDGDIYSYSLSITSSQVIDESLYYSPLKTRRNRCLFERSWNGEAKKYTWKNGEDFTGSHAQLQPNIKQEELFISLIISQLDIKIIRPLSQWILFHVPSITLESERRDRDALVKYYKLGSNSDAVQLSNNVFSLIQKFDTGIDGIEIRKSVDADNFAMYALHNTPEGKIEKWLLEEESLGTQRLMGLAMRIFYNMSDGGLTVIDEISANIHPNITRVIIKMFQNPKSNPNHAQLIFTSHDNTLQRNNLLRRDQIWFTEKREDRSTALYPLTDFKVRNDLAIDRAYLDGRFGAVPFLPDDDELIIPIASK